MELPAWFTEAAQLFGLFLSVALFYALQMIRKRFEKQLDRTESKINEVAHVTNGRLDKALEDLALMTECATKYRLLWENEHKLLTELNSTAEGRALLDSIASKHRIVIHDAALQEVLARLMRHPPGDQPRHD